MALYLTGNSSNITIDSTSGITFPNATLQASAGSVLQVVSTFKNDVFSTSSTSFTDITGLSVTITPKFSTSKILIIANIQCSAAANNYFPLNLVRNSTAIAQPAVTSSIPSSMNGYVGDLNINSEVFNVGINYLDSPATTSATTYKIQGTTGAGTAYINSRADGIGKQVSNITVMEIAG